MAPTPLMQEDHISQVPALQLLQNLGYTYLTPAEALALRGGKVSGVLLDGVLETWLREHNVVRFKGEEVPFSEGNIVGAVQALKDVLYDGLVRTNEKVYDLLCLGKSLQQSLQGDLKSFTLQYIDWDHPERNVYHVTEEFSVERSGSRETYRPDLVLFVNGIPLAVIECKRPDLGPGKDPIKEAISQHLRNQKDDGIPQLFLHSQLLLAVSKNQAKYGTTGTPAKFWAVWKEREDVDEALREAVNRPLTEVQKEQLFSGRFAYVRESFDALELEGGRQVTEQDRALYGLCRPERLLELAYRFVLYDAGVKKIARYQQYFCVRKILDRIRRLGPEGTRPGGVVWHTQGSGKSLTMVMLAKAIALEPTIEDHKIVLVTDRIDLDDQLYRTFHSCGKEVEQARTGRDLLEMLTGYKQRIITTVIDKFDAAVGRKDARNDSANLFVLVDEGHRGQYGPRTRR
jgi:type I restriction enzyme R subunit